MKKQIFSAILASAVLLSLPAYAQIKESKSQKELFYEQHLKQQRAFSDTVVEKSQEREEERGEAFQAKKRAAMKQAKERAADNEFGIELEGVDSLYDIDDLE